jgi:hypothetical protein
MARYAHDETGMGTLTAAQIKRELSIIANRVLFAKTTYADRIFFEELAFELAKRTRKRGQPPQLLHLWSGMPVFCIRPRVGIVPGA